MKHCRHERIKTTYKYIIQYNIYIIYINTAKMFRTEDTKYFLDALMHDGCIFDGQACCSCKDEGLFCFVQHYNEWDVSMWQIDMPDFVCLHLMLSQSRDCNDKNGRI